MWLSAPWWVRYIDGYERYADSKLLISLFAFYLGNKLK